MSYNLRLSTKAKSEDLRFRHDYVKYLHKQSILGSRSDQYELALEYHTGSGDIPKNRSKAFFWFRQSAAQGYDSAIRMLANSYILGHGVKKNENEGKRLHSLLQIKLNLRDILANLPNIHSKEEDEQAIKVMMECLYQFTGNIK
jgi:TPR repeat protein